MSDVHTEKSVFLYIYMRMCYIFNESPAFSYLPDFQEEMSGESVVSSAVPAATTRTTSFKGSSASSKYVKLNVGGALYYTTMQTLTKQDTMLKAMFSGRMEVLTDSEGRFTVIAAAEEFM